MQRVECESPAVAVVAEFRRTETAPVSSRFDLQKWQWYVRMREDLCHILYETEFRLLPSELHSSEFREGPNRRKKMNNFATAYLIIENFCKLIGYVWTLSSFELERNRKRKKNDMI